MNILLFSTDRIALDATACRVIALNPRIVPTAIRGEKAGAGAYHSENIESFIDTNFIVNRTPVMSQTSSRFKTFLKNRITPKPAIDKDKCTLCGTCVNMCPVNPKAVDYWVKGNQSGPPEYDYNRCIRCFCCQETCPEEAISIDNLLLAKIASHI